MRAPANFTAFRLTHSPEWSITCPDARRAAELRASAGRCAVTGPFKRESERSGLTFGARGAVLVDDSHEDEDERSQPKDVVHRRVALTDERPGERDTLERKDCERRGEEHEEAIARVAPEAEEEQRRHRIAGGEHAGQEQHGREPRRHRFTSHTSP